MSGADLNRLKNLAEAASDDGVFARAVLELLNQPSTQMTATETHTETRQTIELVDDSVRSKDGSYVPHIPPTFVPGAQAADVNYMNPPAGPTGPGDLRLPGSFDNPDQHGEKAQ
jgi:hypothetical protein